MSEDHKNLILAAVLTVAILFGWQSYVDSQPKPEPQPQAQTQGQGQGQAQQMAPGSVPAAGQGQSQNATPPVASVTNAPVSSQSAIVPSVPGSASTTMAIGQIKETLLESRPHIKIDAPRLRGSIPLTGAHLDDISLIDYHEELDPTSPEISFLQPRGVQKAFFAQFGWSGGQGVSVPNDTTKWTADRKVLTPERPVTLTWNNGQGLEFMRTISIDANYMFVITQKVKNMGKANVTLYPYGLISRQGTPETNGLYILHEGPLGVFNGQLQEIAYDDLQESKSVSETTTGGWLGITDKYWLAALIPDQKAKVKTNFIHRLSNNQDKYQADFLGSRFDIAPGATVNTTSHLFAGAKELSLLQEYGEKLNIPLFDRAIDFGWLYFLTEPIFKALIYLNKLVNNYGLAILLLTVGIKLVFFPLANKSYRAMAKMKKLQPKMLKLREQFGEDKQRLNTEMMALYKKEKANPASGCLPVIVQIPVFFALYKVLFVTIEMRHAPFFGWIHDLSAPDPTSILNLFGLFPWDPTTFAPDILNIGVWPLFMGITMFLQQKLNPQPPDPIQAKIFMFLPIMFTFMLASFPAGLVVYWAWNNLLSIAQQWVIMKKVNKT
jgi:YidC/Oxa1 family membrane protein insertase